MNNSTACAIDLSGPFASFAVSCNRELLCSESLVLKNRNNNAFFDSFFEVLEKRSISSEKIDKWIIGTGPGSFTGSRVASSFILGITYQTKKTLLGIPSAFPIASAMNLNVDETAGILFPGTRDLLFIYEIKNEGKYGLKSVGDIKVAAIKDLSDINNYHRLACIENQVTQEIISSIGKKIEIFNSFPIQNMFDDFQNNYTDVQDLLYVRDPAVITSRNI